MYALALALAALTAHSGAVVVLHHAMSPAPEGFRLCWPECALCGCGARARARVATCGVKLLRLAAGRPAAY